MPALPMETIIVVSTIDHYLHQNFPVIERMGPCNLLAGIPYEICDVSRASCLSTIFQQASRRSPGISHEYDHVLLPLPTNVVSWRNFSTIGPSSRISQMTVSTPRNEEA
jgi:hypothetical protein